MVLSNLNAVCFTGLLVIGMQLDSKQDDVVEIVGGIAGQSDIFGQRINLLMLQEVLLRRVFRMFHGGLQCNQIGFVIFGDRVVVVAVIQLSDKHEFER